MKNPKILVVGDLMIDHYIWGSCDRISPEAPVQVIKIQNETKRLGGAGNVVSNLKALGAEVGLISVLGDDEAGAQTRELLKDLELCYEKIFIEEGRQSSIKSRVMASNQQVVRIDKESVERISYEMELIMEFERKINEFDLVLLSDYGKGVLSKKVCITLIKIAKKFDKKILIDPKGDYTKYQGATLLTPNKKEASEATGIKITDKDSLMQAIKILKNQFCLQYPLITISEGGIALLDGDELEIFPAIAKEVYDVTGAGDSVLATLGYSLAKNDDIKEAIKTANLAAAVVVAKVGSANATFEEIEKLRKNESLDFQRKIKTKEELISILKEAKNKKIVFTNGCFDILHLGHIKYLQKAKSFGDILIIGLNSDNSVKKLKGNDRPVNSEFDRACLLCALEFVDFVVIFDEDTPLELIKQIKPNILVKGADYEGKEVVGSDIVEDVRLVEFVDGKSTSKIIEKIKG